MAVNPPLTIQAKRASLSLSFQPVNNINSTMTTEAFALEKLGQSVNMDIFQELLDLDTPCEMFSKDIVSEFLAMGPETLTTMNDSLIHVNLSQLNTSAQSLRCASMVLGLTRIEKACARIEVILNLCIDLHYSGFALDQICDALAYVVKEARVHFELARTAFSSFYDLPLPSPREDASDTSFDSMMF